MSLITPYQLWALYIADTDLQSKIGPNRFAELLTKNQAIELIQSKGYLKCKILNKQKIEATLLQLQSGPWASLFSLWAFKLAKRLRSLQNSGRPEQQQ